MIIWLNQNQGFVMALLTFSYVATTIGILVFSIYAAHLQKKAITMTFRPYIIIDLYPKVNFMYLRIKNCGPAPASDISLTFHQSVQIHNDQTLAALMPAPVWPALGPNTDIQFLLDDVTGFRKKNPALHMLTGTVAYNGPFAGHYRDQLTIPVYPHARIVDVS